MNNTNQSLKDFLDTTGCIKKGMMVSMPLIPQMVVYGFVVIGKQEQAIEMFCSAILEGKSYCILPLGPVEVYGDRVLFKSVDKNMPNRLPIFSEVNRQEVAQLPLLNLYVPAFALDKNKKSIYSSYQQQKKQYKALELPNVESVDGTYVYNLSPEDYVFSSHSIFKGVGEDFRVICRRINGVTGEILYEICSSDDVYPTKAK